MPRIVTTPSATRKHIFVHHQVSHEKDCYHRSMLVLFALLLFNNVLLAVEAGEPLAAAKKTLASPIKIAADHLQSSINKQNKSTRYHSPSEHKHRQFLSSSYQKKHAPQTGTNLSSLDYYFRLALAGGIAGATGTMLLYPMDSAKTLRQSDPSTYKSVRGALRHLFIDKSLKRQRFARVYSGVIPATLGAIPSSALYFGAYEAMKSVIQHIAPASSDRTQTSGRLFVHAISAMSGNILSSLVFVPKEVLKQQMQFQGGSLNQVFLTIMKTKGIRGIYSGYQATLMRNIPSAMIRFVIYEELKWAWYVKHKQTAAQGEHTTTGFSWRLFAAGAVAGGLASGFMTPIDVLKTRLSTGTCPVDVPSCFMYVVRNEGWPGLYAGAYSRMTLSGLFSAIGFGSFETAKGWLGVSDQIKPKAVIPDKPVQMFPYRTRSLLHALGDVFEDKEK